MNILYITLDPVEASSSAMMRNVGVIRGLMENSHNVDVLSIHSNVNNIINEDVFPPNVDVIRLGSSSLYNKLENKSKQNLIKRTLSGFLRKVYKKVSLYNNTYFTAKKVNLGILQNTEYDIVISSSDPKTSHVVARRFKKQGLKVGKWIQYWGDPMSADITNTVIWPQWMIAFIEKEFLKSADSIVYVSPFTLDKQKTLFKRYKDRMHFVPIPYISSKQYEIKKGDTSKLPLKVSYLGSYYSNIRNLIPFYNAINKCANQFELVIAGSTDIKLESTKNIKVLPNMPWQQVTQYEDESDIIVCVLNKNGTQIPGKLYHYAGTNKPILVIIDGEYGNKIRSYLEKFNRYVFCENNEKEISKALEGLIKLRDCKPAECLSPSNIAKKIIDPQKEFCFGRDSV